MIFMNELSTQPEITQSYAERPFAPVSAAELTQASIVEANNSLGIAETRQDVDAHYKQTVEMAVLDETAARDYIYTVGSHMVNVRRMTTERV
jgi:hypothetical protein